MWVGMRPRGLSKAYRAAKMDREARVGAIACGRMCFKVASYSGGVRLASGQMIINLYDNVRDGTGGMLKVSRKRGKRCASVNVEWRAEVSAVGLTVGVCASHCEL